ncbi:MAG: peptidase M16 [Phycisphaerales bacterium]|nr:MAG: peptidase M16 [Phycisphaerales bacterium]
MIRSTTPRLGPWRHAIVLALGLVAFARMACGQDQPQTQAQPQTQSQTQDQPQALADTPDPSAPLPEDPRLVRGTLANGLRYVVVPNAEPPGRVELWLHVHSGSLNEQDDQRGLAHFLEHLAFAGSANFPPGTVRPFFEGLGMSFGRHQNAVTGFDRTGYTLSLPNAEPATLDAALTFLSDVAFNLLLPEEGIEQERAIILEERRAGLSPQQRVLYEVIERIAPGSTFGQRIPIGTEEVLTNAGREAIERYYTRWYVPSNMTLVVVGDVRPEAIIERIETHFGKGQAVPRPTPRDVGIEPTHGRRAIVASDPEHTAEEVAINAIGRPLGPTTTVGRYRQDLVQMLGVSIMNDRLSDAVQDGRLSMLGGSVSTGDFAGVIRWTQATGRSEPGRWRQVLEELGREIRRATLHGLTPQELADAKERLLAGAERAMEAEPTRPSRTLRSAVVEAVAAGEPFMSVAQQVELLRALLPTVTLEEVNEAFASAFAFEDAVFTLQTKRDEHTPSEEALLEAGVQALAVEPEPYQPQARAQSLLAQPPTPGQVVERTLHEATGVTSIWLSNGVRVHIKPMAERKGEILGSVHVFGGLVHEDAQTRGLTDAAATALARPAGGGLSSTQIDDLTSGWKASVRGGSDADGLTVGLSASPEALEDALSLVHLLLTDPTVEPAAIEQWRRGQLRTLETLDRLPQGEALKAIIDAIYPPDDPRPRLIPRERIEAITVQDAQDWLNEQLDGPIEAVLVGDLDVEHAVRLVATYLGSLPKRPRVSSQTNLPLRQMPRPVGPIEMLREPQVSTPQAYVIAGYYGPNEWDEDDRRAMRLAARILSTRMIARIREQLGLAYSPSVSSRTGTTWPGFGLFSVQTPTDPQRAQELADELHAMFLAFAQDGPSQEELDVAVEQLRNVLDESVRSPGSWLRELRTLEYLGRSMDALAQEREALGRFTPDGLRDAFARYAVEEGRIRVIVRPRPPADEGQQPEAGQNPAQDPAQEPAQDPAQEPAQDPAQDPAGV